MWVTPENKYTLWWPKDDCFFILSSEQKMQQNEKSSHFRVLCPMILIVLPLLS